jgi:hypothetical protein
MAEPSAEAPALAARPGSQRRGGSRVEVMPVHSTAQDPFQDVMAQREMCGKGEASHAVVGVRAVEGGSAAALHGGGIEGPDGEAEAVSEGGLELPALEFQGS